MASAPARAGFLDFKLAHFIGASAGQSTTDMPCPAASPCDDSDTAWKIFGGLEANEYISMVIGYADLGEVSVTGATTGTAEINGVTLARVGTFAVNPSFTLIGRDGMNILNLDVKTTGADAMGEGDTDVAWSLGLGAQYNLTELVGLRVEYERFFDVGDDDTTGEADVDLISAGIVYKF